VAIVKLVLAYDGTEFAGWQRQPGRRSVQAVLETALAPIAGRPVTVVGAGRTDAGVHALGQVAHVEMPRAIEPAIVQRALNAKLPPDVRVRGASDAPPGFHARFGARRKTYRYQIRRAPWVSPFEHRYVWHVADVLDLDAMAAAAARLVGRRDFGAFRSLGSRVRSTERTVYRLDVTGAEDPDGTRVTIEIEADGFLRHMARAIVGTLVEVGLGRRTPESLEGVLASRDRARAGPTAPARGLFLVRVDYE
jgi:tRNA pseudouridine38-40 synthase